MSKGLNYFIHDSDAVENETLSILRGLYGNDGYAFWFITLECLVQSDEMQLDCSDRKNWLRYVAKCNISEAKANEIIEALVSLEAIDAELWNKKRIIWSDALVKRLKTKLTRRIDGVPEKPKIETPAKKKTVKPVTRNVIKYAEYVSMTETEYNKLVEKYGENATKKFIEVLDNYKGSTGKKYKDDYRAILNWVVESTFEKYPYLKNSNAQKSNPFDSVQIPDGYRGDM